MALWTYLFLLNLTADSAKLRAGVLDTHVVACPTGEPTA